MEKGFENEKVLKPTKSGVVSEKTYAGNVKDLQTIEDLRKEKMALQMEVDHYRSLNETLQQTIKELEGQITEERKLEHRELAVNDAMKNIEERENALEKKITDIKVTHATERAELCEKWVTLLCGKSNTI